MSKIPEKSLFVVGDDAQSIYGFRGSKIELILNLHRNYPDLKEIILNQNYRSTQPILDLAEKVLSHNPRQKKKDLFTQNPDQIQVKYYLARNERDEAEYIIKQITKQYAEVESKSPKNSEDLTENPDLDLQVEGFFDAEYDSEEKSIDLETREETSPVSSMFDFYLGDKQFNPPSSLMNYQPNSWNPQPKDWSKVEKLNDCAVLYRTHAQSRSLEETFLKHHIPYRLVSGTRFLDRREVKDVLAVLRFILNSQDTLAFARFVPLVLKGVGPKTLQKLIQFLTTGESDLNSKQQTQLLELLATIQTVWSRHNNLIDFTKDILTELGYFNYLKKLAGDKDELETRMDNIGELYSLMLPFEKAEEEDQIELEKSDSKIDKEVSPDSTKIPLHDKLQNFLSQISLMSQQENESLDDSPKINLMSLHQAKGLEFETVFLVGIEDGILPHINSFNEIGGIEEEVRLAYVGVTRAKKYLHLINAESRVQYGQIKSFPTSRIFRPFLDSHCQRIFR